MDKKASKSLIILLGLTILTKALGFLKTSIIAACFGATIQTDIYNLADGIINQVFYAFTISISVIIVPLYLMRKENSEHEGKRFAKSAYLTMGLFGVALVILILIASPFIAKVIGRAYEEPYIQLLTQYMQILALGIMLSMVTNTIQSILNAEREYGFPSVCAMINSVVIILFAILFSDTLGVWALVLSVPVAYLIQTLFLRIKAAKYLKISLRKAGGLDTGIKTLFSSMLPVFLSNATMELNGFLDKYILAGLEEGAVTAISYAMVLLVFATNIISIPITTVLFTDVSELCSKKEYDKVRIVTEKSIISVLMICIPIMIITVFCAGDIVSFVYGYGKFTEEAVRLTSVALAGYGLSIVFYVLKDIINRVSYALLETKLPMITGIIATVVHVASALLLTPYCGILGVVWATIISVGLTAFLTLIILSRKHLHFKFRKYLGNLLKISVATTAMIGVVAMLNQFVNLNVLNGKIDTLLNLLIYTAAGFVAYFGVLLLCKESLSKELFSGIMNKAKTRK